MKGHGDHNAHSNAAVKLLTGSRARRCRTPGLWAGWRPGQGEDGLEIANAPGTLPVHAANATVRGPVFPFISFSFRDLQNVIRPKTLGYCLLASRRPIDLDAIDFLRVSQAKVQGKRTLR